MIKVAVIILFITKSLYDLFIIHLESSDHGRPLPDNVRDVYDPERYRKYLSYKKENGRLEVFSFLVGFAVNLLFLLLNVYALIFNRLGDMNIYLAYFTLTAIITLITSAVKLPFSFYGTFTIEEKYGMNRTTKKTFFLDRIKAFVLSLLVMTVILFVMIFFFSRYGIKGVIGTTIAVVALSLLISALVIPLLRIFNRFTPLEDGELKEKLLSLCTKYKVKVKRIVVKDASRRTTTSNAFCTGLKEKTISIDDNLINNFTTDEIVAVFAHEFAHARFRHILKSLPFSLAGSVITILFFGLMLEYTPLFTAFGFEGVNYFFALSVMGIITWPAEIIGDIILNAISRKHEYEADRFAATEGYGEALVSALKRLHNEALGEINPARWVVLTCYSHPTLSQRISAIEKAENKDRG